ncbi:reverse transcriptase domain-containing protein [Tanacetum coccineum]
MEETLPAETEKARAIRLKSGRYDVVNDILYKKSYLGPWLRCVGPLQANYVLREIHEGSCSMHAGTRSVVAKHARRNKIRGSKGNTNKILLAHNARGCKKIDPGMSGLPGSPPRAKKPATKADSHYCFASVKHPQANGLVERANISLGEGIKARLDERSKYWIEEVPHVLWAHRTMIKSSNGNIPFSLTYGTEAVIPAEIGMPTFRTAEIDMVQNDEALKINLDLLEERREEAAIREAISKAKMEKYYNSKVRNTSFKPGDLVYRNKDASHAKDSGKLSLKWEGPYEVTKSLGNEAYKLRDRMESIFRELGMSATSRNVTYMQCKHLSHASFAVEGALFEFLF